MAIVKPKKGNVVFNVKERWIALCGPINQETAIWFLKFLLQTHAENNDWEKSIIVFINSKGGDAVASFQIYALLRASELPVTTIVVGKAYSGALTVAQAGAVRKILAGAKMKMHDAHYQVRAAENYNWKDLFLIGKRCLRINGSTCRLFSRRAKINFKKIEKLLYENKIFAAKEAKKHRLADEIINCRVDLKKFKKYPNLMVPA